MHRLLAACSLALLGPIAPPSQAQTASFELAPAGCAMAHCSPRLSDDVKLAGPAVGNLVAIDSAAPGGKAGVGCASNTHIVACSKSSEPPERSNLVVYDASGQKIWDDGGILGATAWQSAPIVGTDGSVIAADQNWILRAHPATNRILWKFRKPDLGNPISPILVGNDVGMVLLATGSSTETIVPEISVWDAASGALLAHQPIFDPANGRTYETRNTPAAIGSHFYVLTVATDDETDGRLYAFDVCDSAACGGRGTITTRWHYDFKGPSGASPLVIGSDIFFDGRPSSRVSQFMAVTDRGSSASLKWKRKLIGTVPASAAQDPRGGLWLFTIGADSVQRLNATTGAVDQEVVVGTATGLGEGYSAASVISLSQSDSGAVVLTFGVQNLRKASLPLYVAAVDVSSTAAGTGLWTYRFAPNAAANLTLGQFPVVVSPTGARRVVFQGSKSSTFFVGEP